MTTMKMSGAAMEFSPPAVAATLPQRGSTGRRLVAPLEAPFKSAWGVWAVFSQPR